MKGSSIIALISLGAATFIGLGVLFQWFYLGFEGNEHGLLFPVLAVAVAAALFVLGVFLGYPFGKAALSQEKHSATLSRFREALEFERSERLRLERELLESKKVTVNLEDRLRRQIEASRKSAADKRAEQTQQELEKLKAELADIRAHEQHIKEDLSKRKERIADLMAELSLAQTDAEQAQLEVHRLKATLSPAHPASIHNMRGSSMKDVLEELVKLDGVQVALVADDYGLVVESAGEGLAKDMLAALSSLVSEIGPRVKDVLPIGEVATISLADDRGLAVDTRFFELLDTRCALLIARDVAFTYPGLIERASQTIAEGLSD